MIAVRAMTSKPRGATRPIKRPARSAGVGRCLLAVAAALLAAAGAGSAGAADTEGRFAVKGAARTTCAQFIKVYDEREEKPQLYLIFAGWLEGYVSALNERTDETYDLLAFETTELIARLLYANCRRNPEEKFFNVVRSMVSVLAPSRLTAFSRLIEVNGAVTTPSGESRDVTLHVYAEALEDAQAKLKAAGHFAGEPDGVFTEETRAALEAYQKAESITPTGLPDQITLLKLLRQSSPD